MSIRNLKSLLAPASVALIGASSRLGSLGRIVLDRVLCAGFSGDVFAVNPNIVDVSGARWFGTIEALPVIPDMAFVMTPPQTVPDVVRRLGQRGVKLAIVLTAGITAGSELHSAMLEAARSSGLRIIGPNCLGVLMPHVGLDASFTGTTAKPGRLALISQSGALVTAILDWAAKRDIGFSAVVSVGDMADTDVGDLLDLFATDAKTDAILLYVESIGDAAKFMSAARAAARNKPIIAIKAGRGEAAGRATLSHSGALAGSYEVYRTAFDRAGIVTVDSLGELLDAAEILAAAPIVRGERVAVITNEGGAGILAADEIQRHGGTIAELAPATVTALDAVLAPTWSKGNPIDLASDSRVDRYRHAIAAVTADDSVDAIVVIHGPTAVVLAEEVAAVVVEALDDVPNDKPVIACWMGAQKDSVQAVFRPAGIPIFTTPEDAARGLSYLFAARRASSSLVETAPVAATRPSDGRTARAVISKVRSENRILLDEIESKKLLSAFNIPVGPTHFAKRPEDVADACAGLAGPFVVKIISPDLTHKSDVGGVTLDLRTPASAATAAARMADAIRREHPAARLSGFSVQTMITSANAIELFIGVAQDPTFGPVVLFGSGGTAVEAVNDIAMALPPLDRDGAKALIGRTRVSRLLGGYRGHPAVALDSLIDSIVEISQLLEQVPEIHELDVNPVLCSPEGIVVLDARIVLTTDVGAASRMAIRPVPAAWSANIVTRAGVALHIRPAVPSDAALLSAFFRQVTPEDLRFRFLSSIGKVDLTQITVMTQVDYRRTISFLALEPAGSVVAAVMLAADPDLERAEIAMSTRSDMKGKGVSYTLLQHVLRYAEAQGIAIIEAVEFADHDEALRMERELGFTALSCPDDPSLRIVRRALSEHHAC
jgi:acetyltransferase